MQQISENELMENINNGTISPYRLYSTDVDYPQYFSVDYYLNHPYDNIEKEQKLKMMFLDIEVYTNHAGVFPKPESAMFPISALTTYVNTENKYIAYLLLMSKNFNKFPVDNIEDVRQEYKKILKENNYINDEELELKIYTNEIEMVKQYWVDLHKVDPAAIATWNGDTFDIPYKYYRTVKLFEDNESKAHSIMSKFGKVDVKYFSGKTIIDFPEFTSFDLYYLFKPRADGGLTY